MSVGDTAPGPDFYRGYAAFVLDTCVLVPAHLVDLLLTLAQLDLYVACWTPDIEQELARNLPISAEAINRRLDAMAKAMTAIARSQYEHLIDAQTVDPKDRHVLAAAIGAGADGVITANVRHFRSASHSGKNVAIVHPDDFLVGALVHAPYHVTSAIQILRARRGNTEMPLARLLEIIGRQAPKFAMQAAILHTD